MKKYLFLFTIVTIFLSANEISEYKAVNLTLSNKDKIYSLIRTFKSDGINNYLVVDNSSLNTKILNENEIKSYKKIASSNTRYKNLLKNNYNEPFLLQNYGIKDINSKKQYLSVDMCPSQKDSYEKEFYTKLANQNKNIPLVVFMTGKWIENHQSDLEELISFSKDKKLNIIWGNHSLTHFYDKELPFEKNFLLKENTDVKNEILELEKILISNGITPSILFRFPGLVSNKNAVETVNSLGLLVVGSNAWLAKGEQVKDGSIILVHGNKNEHKGIEKFDELNQSITLNYGNLLEDL